MPISDSLYQTHCTGKFDFQDDEWSNTREFMRAVKRRSFEAESEEQIHATGFDGACPAGEVGRIISEAVDSVLRNDWEDAPQLLRAEFGEQSICVEEKPEYE